MRAGGHPALFDASGNRPEGGIPQSLIYQGFSVMYFQWLSAIIQIQILSPRPKAGTECHVLSGFFLRFALNDRIIPDSGHFGYTWTATDFVG